MPPAEHAEHPEHLSCHGSDHTVLGLASPSPTATLVPSEASVGLVPEWVK